MSTSDVRVGIAGAAGRMGRMLVAGAHETDGLVCSAALEHPQHEALGVDAGTLAGLGAIDVPVGANLEAVLSDIDVLIEFSLPEPTLEHLELCAVNGVSAILGTTGFSPEQRARIGEAARSVPVMFAPNMSVGVNVMFKLIELAAQALGDSVDVEVIEAHHRYKVDAPSGTAVRMGEILAEALGRDLTTDAVYGRQGHTGARERRTIGFETIRGGDIVGDHTVLFAGEGERIELTHRSHTRANFAHGALRAAAWLKGKPAGLYDMQDVLGFS
jgi:4-hydroxy-tetrahydrodipicolinate reductase